MFLKFTLLALFLLSLAAGLPIRKTSPNTATESPSSPPFNISSHALVERKTDNPPFDGDLFNRNNGPRTDGSPVGDVFRLTKCYCVDTPSRDLPTVYGQYYGSYYGFDYYNYHKNRSYSFSWTCASGELESLQAEWTAPEAYYLAPLCLSWQEERRKECWHTSDGNTFCFQLRGGKDFYYWNGQWRQVHNHPAKEGTTKMAFDPLNDECQRMCQTVPGNTPGYMQDVYPSDHEHKIVLVKSTQCTPSPGTLWTSVDACLWPGNNPAKNPPRVWDTWNYIETYTDQADMCEWCA